MLAQMWEPLSLDRLVRRRGTGPHLLHQLEGLRGSSPGLDIAVLARPQVHLVQLRLLLQVVLGLCLLLLLLRVRLQLLRPVLLGLLLRGLHKGAHLRIHAEGRPACSHHETRSAKDLHAVPAGAP